MANNLLAGKKGIIFGALDSNSIAWKTAIKGPRARCSQFTLTNAPVAMRMGEINKLAAQCGTIVIPADATVSRGPRKARDPIYGAPRWQSRLRASLYRHVAQCAQGQSNIPTSTMNG